MSERRWIGLDVGQRRIGIAVSDPTGVVAQPYGVQVRKGMRRCVEELRRLAVDLGAAGFVIGLPRRTDGRLGPEAAGVDVFAARLGEASGLPVHKIDERFTTAEAERVLIAGGVRRARRRSVIDQNAAALILQTFLDKA